MVSLLSLLDLGAGGLAAANAGVSVAANNTANVNTRGYSRQRVDFHSGLGAPVLGGVTAGSPRRYASELLATRERLSQSGSGRADARASALADLEAAVAGTGSGIDEDIAKLWAGLQRVAAMPADSLVRDAAVAAARALADGIRERAEAVARARAEADARIRDAADQATVLARQIADANHALASGDDPVMRDRRDVAAQDLAALVGGDGRIDADGQMRWVLPDGGVLVDGDRAATLTATPDPATGFATVELVSGSQRRDVTAAIDGGAMGGDLAFRDRDATSTLGELDELAFDLTTSINTVHRGGAGLDGVVGRDLFTAQAGIAGAASRMSVDAAVAADSGKLAAAAPGTGAGNNKQVLALLALRDGKVARGGTATLGESALRLATGVGRATADAHAEQTRERDLAGHLGGLRDALSGVDLDEELGKMVHFQHASEAMTRFVSTIDGMLGDLLQRL